MKGHEENYWLQLPGDGWRHWESQRMSLSHVSSSFNTTLDIHNTSQFLSPPTPVPLQEVVAHTRFLLPVEWSTAEDIMKVPVLWIISCLVIVLKKARSSAPSDFRTAETTSHSLKEDTVSAAQRQLDKRTSEKITVSCLSSVHWGGGCGVCSGIQIPRSHIDRSKHLLATHKQGQSRM